MSKNRTIRFAEHLYCRFQDDEVPAMGAQLTYYLILAVFPFLIFLVALIGYTPFTTADMMDAVSKLLPDLSNQVLAETLDGIQNNRSHTLLSIGMIGTLWSASSGVNAIIKALNKAYDEPETRPFWRVKGLSLLCTVILTVVIFLSLALLIFGRWLGDRLSDFFSLPAFFDEVWAVGQFAIPVVIIAVVFLFLYRYVPNRHLTFRSVLPGALFATLGWILASSLFAFYVNNFGNYTKTYGSLGGIIVLLTWLYISGIIIVVGGEINATLAFDAEGKAKPDCKKFALELPFLKKKKGGKPLPPSANT
ncbi:YihY/virulence factor BrkB family protein [Cohnella nanjingensis]|uniref:YihY/virulence factor BrkB family protein n=1 Tax=Cohnella nanjingensis TaxID=1387779 RepID=A0A7X0RWN1_9BACL|nr:YihY/virulence factor BrkB family protein [Cohnella nanjingensis]MBB6674991.1 YihY/virulence factor BrkB family protein [Cohnella nanjingensis]